MEIKNAPLQAGILFRRPRHRFETTAHPPNQDFLLIPVVAAKRKGEHVTDKKEVRKEGKPLACTEQ